MLHKMLWYQSNENQWSIFVSGIRTQTTSPHPILFVHGAGEIAILHAPLSRY